MKKSLLSLGRTLSRAEQQHIQGGVDVFRRPCTIEEVGGKCCYTIESHITDKKNDVDNWVKEKVCI